MEGDGGLGKASLLGEFPSSSVLRGNLIQCELLDCGDLAAFSRIADDEEEEGLFSGGALQDLIKKLHRARCVGQGS